MAEHRAHTRYPARIEVRIESPLAPLEEYTADFSEGGLFLETDRPLEPQTPVGLRFFVPQYGRPLEVTGRVAHTRPGGAPGAGGMGIAFGRLPPPTRRVLGEFVAQLGAGEQVL